MKKPQLVLATHESKRSTKSSTAYASYIVGFVLSVALTLLAYALVVMEIFTGITLLLVVTGVAVLQLVVQMVFFLHIGRGSKWKLLTLIFTVVFLAIVVVGTIWVMHHLNYNMMHMSPEEMTEYMHLNEGI